MSDNKGPLGLNVPQRALLAVYVDQCVYVFYKFTVWGFVEVAGQSVCVFGPCHAVECLVVRVVLARNHLSRDVFKCFHNSPFVRV